MADAARRYAMGLAAVPHALDHTQIELARHERLGWPGVICQNEIVRNMSITLATVDEHMYD